MVLLLISLLLLVAYDAACDIPAVAAVDPAITDNSEMDPRSWIYINALRIRKTPNPTIVDYQKCY
jgi:hypothetical protein